MSMIREEMEAMGLHEEVKDADRDATEAVKLTVKSLAKRLKELEQTENAKWKSQVADLTAKLEEMEPKYKTLVEFYDKHNGTPCEQIRHQQQVDGLTRRLEEAHRLLGFKVSVECRCEVCAMTSELCTATRSSYLEHIHHLTHERNTLQTSLAAMEQERDTLQAKRDVEWAQFVRLSKDEQIQTLNSKWAQAKQDLAQVRAAVEKFFASIPKFERKQSSVDGFEYWSPTGIMVNTELLHELQHALARRKG